MKEEQQRPRKSAREKEWEEEKTNVSGFDVQLQDKRFETSRNAKYIAFMRERLFVNPSVGRNPVEFDNINKEEREKWTKMTGQINVIWWQSMSVKKSFSLSLSLAHHEIWHRKFLFRSNDHSIIFAAIFDGFSSPLQCVLTSNPLLIIFFFGRALIAGRCCHECLGPNSRLTATRERANARE